jgi:hypothetical protein
MRSLARPLTHLGVFLLLAVAGNWLWLQHARAWDLGQRSPVLSYDAAQYAVAARELAMHGRFATTSALPVELARHPSAPWPLALVQPGLVIGEALLYRFSAPVPRLIDGRMMDPVRPDQREWLALVIPFVCYIVIAIALALGCMRLLRRYADGMKVEVRGLMGGLLGAAFLLDPESQHFATGGFTELPFTLGLIGATVALALGLGARRPLVLGLLLGLTGAFRGTMLWLAPIFALLACLSGERGHGVRVFVRVMLGYAIPLAPWWLYKWHAFGTPSWDLSAWSVWDGVQGRSWFTIFNRPEIPELPGGFEAVRLLAQKLGRNLPGVLLTMGSGLRPLEAGAIVVWLWVSRGAPRALRAAAILVLALAFAGISATAISVPQLRYMFPTRVLLEAAGALAVFAIIAEAKRLSGASRAVIAGVFAVLLLLWGVRLTRLGNVEARETSHERGVPGTLTLLRIASMMNREIPKGEPVMSNLGATLAWEARRPVIHLSVSPDDLTACRRYTDFRNVFLVFRDAKHAWSEWQPVVDRPLESLHRVEWNVRHVRQYDSGDGFVVIWLELGPLGPELAAH